MRGRRASWGWLLGGSLLLVACGRPMAASPTATQTAAALPTASPIVTEIPTKGATPTPATTLPAVSPTATEAPTERATATATVPTERDPFQPPSAERCEGMRALVSDVVGGEATVATTLFEDYVQGVQGAGCTVEARVPPESFATFSDVALALGSAIEAQGLIEDFMYVADGPQGTGTAFREPSEGLLCLLQVSQEETGQPYAVRLQCAVASPPT